MILTNRSIHRYQFIGRCIKRGIHSVSRAVLRRRIFLHFNACGSRWNQFAFAIAIAGVGIIDGVAQTVIARIARKLTRTVILVGLSVVVTSRRIRAAKQHQLTLAIAVRGIHIARSGIVFVITGVTWIDASSIDIGCCFVVARIGIRAALNNHIACTHAIIAVRIVHGAGIAVVTGVTWIHT